MEDVMVNENVVEEVMENCEVNPSTSGNGVIGVIVAGVGLAVAAGIGFLAYKNRHRIEERKIASLKKKGYVIYKSDEPTEINVDFEDELK